eukprot:Rhum_TRINITY_DN2797_c0_g1::Rhum_TRINITY_DN2797_c0_g1_i1::g.8362::m.8362
MHGAARRRYVHHLHSPAVLQGPCAHLDPRVAVVRLHEDLVALGTFASARRRHRQVRYRNRIFEVEVQRAVARRARHTRVHRRRRCRRRGGRRRRPAPVHRRVRVRRQAPRGLRWCTRPAVRRRRPCRAALPRPAPAAQPAVAGRRRAGRGRARAAEGRAVPVGAGGVPPLVRRFHAGARRLRHRDRGDGGGGGRRRGRAGAAASAAVARERDVDDAGGEGEPGEGGDADAGDGCVLRQHDGAGDDAAALRGGDGAVERVAVLHPALRGQDLQHPVRLGEGDARLRQHRRRVVRNRLRPEPPLLDRDQRHGVGDAVAAAVGRAAGEAAVEEEAVGEAEHRRRLRRLRPVRRVVHAPGTLRGGEDEEAAADDVEVALRGRGLLGHRDDESLRRVPAAAEGLDGEAGGVRLAQLEGAGELDVAERRLTVGEGHVVACAGGLVDVEGARHEVEAADGRGGREVLAEDAVVGAHLGGGAAPVARGAQGGERLAHHLLCVEEVVREDLDVLGGAEALGEGDGFLGGDQIRRRRLRVANLRVSADEQYRDVRVFLQVCLHLAEPLHAHVVEAHAVCDAEEDEEGACRRVAQLAQRAPLLVARRHPHLHRVVLRRRVRVAERDRPPADGARRLQRQRRRVLRQVLQEEELQAALLRRDAVVADGDDLQHVRRRAAAAVVVRLVAVPALVAAALHAEAAAAQTQVESFFFAEAQLRVEADEVLQLASRHVRQVRRTAGAGDVVVARRQVRHCCALVCLRVQVCARSAPPMKYRYCSFY